MAPDEMTLLEELVLMLLSEESGYMEQVAGWNLSCALVGAQLADLSLERRIDMDLEQMKTLESKPTGNQLLDPLLEQIATYPESQTVQYWVEKCAPKADDVLEATLGRLEENGLLNRHSGGFWSLSRKKSASGQTLVDAQSKAEVRQRIIATVLDETVIPDPRDVLLIGLANACDAFRFLLEPDAYLPSVIDRIEFIENLDLVTRSVTKAVAESSLHLSLAKQVTKPIPKVKLLKLLTQPSMRELNAPRVFADLHAEYGPVFAIKPPFGKPLVCLVGNEANIWVNRHGRLYLNAKGYIEEFEQKVFQASRSMTGMEGAEHFRMRKAQRHAHSRARLFERLDELYAEIRASLETWKVGEVMEALPVLRHHMSGQTSQLQVGIDTSYIMKDLLVFKNRALLTHVQHTLPEFMMHTPRMRRIRRQIDDLYLKIYTAHSSAQRGNRPRDVVDDLIALHRSDPQFLPEVDMKFALVMPLITALYMANGLGFLLHSLAVRPELHKQVQEEADNLFADGDPGPEDLLSDKLDITMRTIMETFRLFPAVPMQLRDVVNHCTFQDYELNIGQRVLIAGTAPHYMPANYPDPLEFDIDRYLPDREEHKRPGAWGLFGLGTHACLGQRWAEVQIAVNVLMILHRFNIEVTPKNAKLKLNPFPTNGPRGDLKFLIKSRH